MYEIPLIIISSISAVLLLGVILYLVIKDQRQKNVIDVYTKQLAVSTHETISEIQKIFDQLKMKPGQKGGFGEAIVEILLSNLPKGFVKSQYEPPDIPARIDFVVKLPESDLYIPIDSKFILSDEIMECETIDKKMISKINTEVISKAKDIDFYASSEETVDFVLMFIPDVVYGFISQETYIELADLRVIPTNTGGLLSVIFMISMQHRFVNLNEASRKIGEFQTKLNHHVTDILENLRKGRKALRRGLNNVIDTETAIEKLKNAIETLEIDEE